MAKKKARKYRKPYSVYVYPEGSNKGYYTGSSFKSKKSASTFANIETVAGMGETYRVKDNRKRTNKKSKRKRKK